MASLSQREFSSETAVSAACFTPKMASDSLPERISRRTLRLPRLNSPRYSGHCSHSECCPKLWRLQFCNVGYSPAHSVDRGGQAEGSKGVSTGARDELEAATAGTTGGDTAEAHAIN